MKSFTLKKRTDRPQRVNAAPWSTRKQCYVPYLILLIALTVIAGCRRPDITDRPYMGFTPLPYDLPTEPYVEAITYGFLKFHSTLMAHHMVLPTENRWSRWHVRAPSVVEHDGTLYMWFAADDFEEGVTDPSEAITGLGLAILPA